MLAKDIKTGTIVNYQDAPYAIETIMVQTPSARGAATLYKFRARNLITKQKIDLTLRGTDTLDEADFQKRSVSLMFSDGTHHHFLDQESYEQYAIVSEDIKQEIQYMKDDLQGMQSLIYNDECVGIQLPQIVELKITECDPSIKGNSATSRNKPSTLESGLVVQVPEYLSQGEIIKVDTRTGEFVSRV